MDKPTFFPEPRGKLSTLCTESFPPLVNLPGVFLSRQASSENLTALCAYLHASTSAMLFVGDLVTNKVSCLGQRSQ